MNKKIFAFGISVFLLTFVSAQEVESFENTGRTDVLETDLENDLENDLEADLETDLETDLESELE